VLSSQKLLTGNYNNFAGECASPALLSEMMNILNEEHQIQHQVFDEMQKRGWYQTEPAQQQRSISANSSTHPSSLPYRAEITKNSKNARIHGRSCCSWTYWAIWTSSWL
jgi:spore coat protein CotF